jgi:hypothetical protein
MRSALLAAREYKVQKPGSVVGGEVADRHSLGRHLVQVQYDPEGVDRGDEIVVASSTSAYLKLDISKEGGGVLSRSKSKVVNEGEKVVQEGAALILTAAVDVNARRRERLLDDSVVPLLCP